jgi:endonuclease/exonuclease/phosphatase family metal-dependent hydrolase
MKTGMMKVLAVKVLAVWVCVLVVSCEVAPAPIPNGPIKVFSFNLRRFDDAKAANKSVAGFLAGMLRDADVAALQEGLEVSEAAVCEFVRLMGGNRGFVLGPPEGRSAFYRENFLFVYNKDRVRLESSAVYPDSAKKFERPPMAAYFKTNAGFDFIVLNCHIKPDEAKVQTAKEIALLPVAARYFTQLWHEPDVLVVGDLNADGAYYDETDLVQVFPDASWTIITDNSCDTTVSANNAFSYDRIIISKTVREDWLEAWGTVRFDTWAECRKITSAPGTDLSDHYPVWAEFSTINDTD